MAELVPYIAVGGFFLTIATIIFYGGTIKQEIKHTREDVTEIKTTLFCDGGIKDKVSHHEYHIKHMCGVRANGREM